MRLSVIIVNYNVRHFLEQCLRSVQLAMKGIDGEVLVVDNNSVDGSVAMLKSLFPGVKCIANSENLGFSKANNQAIRASSADYVLLLNPDTIVPEDCFLKILDFMDTKPEAGACGIRMIDGQGKFLPESKRGLPTPEVAMYKMLGLNKLFPRSKKFGKYHLGYLDEHEVAEIDVLAGAFMCIRRSVLDSVGLLDEAFFMYGEDIDLSYRIMQAGYKNYYFPHSTIIHYKGESTKKLSANYVRIFYKAMIIFAEKHYKGRHQSSFKAFIYLAIYLRAGLSLTANLFRKYWLLIIETGIVFISLFLLKNYWEEHIKYIKSYPAEMLYIHLPYYTLVWLGSIYLSGSYKHIFHYGKLIRGIFIGTAIIFMIYGLLPDHLRFSRGIIVFGTLLISTSLIIFRSLFHLLKYRTLDFSLRQNTRSILVGSAAKWERVNEILNSSGKNYKQIGFVDDKVLEHENWLGKSAQLQEIVKIYGINEIIFSTESMDAGQVMYWMNKIGPHVSYYTMPAESDFVIGSHSKNSSGLYYGDQIELNLSKPEYRNQKRFFDLIVALCFILFFPVFMFLKGNRDYFKNCLDVLRGRKTWVGYSGNETQSLPVLRPGVFQTDYLLKKPNPQYQKQLDKLYATNYEVMMDVRVVLSRSTG